MTCERGKPDDGAWADGARASARRRVTRLGPSWRPRSRPGQSSSSSRASTLARRSSRRSSAGFGAKRRCAGTAIRSWPGALRRPRPAAWRRGAGAPPATEGGRGRGRPAAARPGAHPGGGNPRAPASRGLPLFLLIESHHRAAARGRKGAARLIDQLRPDQVPALLRYEARLARGLRPARRSAVAATECTPAGRAERALAEAMGRLAL